MKFKNLTLGFVLISISLIQNSYALEKHFDRDEVEQARDFVRLCSTERTIYNPNFSKKEIEEFNNRADVQIDTGTRQNKCAHAYYVLATDSLENKSRKRALHYVNFGWSKLDCQHTNFDKYGPTSSNSATRWPKSSLFQMAKIYSEAHELCDAFDNILRPFKNGLPDPIQGLIDAISPPAY